MGFCWKNHQRFCPRCRSRTVYRLSTGRRRCGRCGYTFHDFTRRYANIGDLTPRQWLWVCKLFELEVAPALMAAQLGLSLGTVHKALTTLRTAILGNSLDAGQLLDGLTGRGEGGRVPVFGILEQAGWIFVDVVPDLTPESVMHFKRNFHLRTARLGGLVYTDPYRQYLALVFSGEARHRYHKHADRGLAVDAGGGFWPFARERLKRLRGVASGRFPLFIKEIEFRYNHRGADMLPVLAGYLCGFVPNLD